MAGHDAFGSGTYSSGTTFSWSHVFAAGSIGAIWVGYKFAAFEDIVATSGVQVGGSNATFQARVTNGGGGNRLELWTHESPGTGSKTVLVTFSGDLGADSGSAAGHSASATGASGWSTATTAGPTTSTTPSVTVPSVGASDMPYAACLVGADITEQDVGLGESSAGGNFLNTQRQAAGGDGVLNWDNPAGDEWMTIGLRAINAAGETITIDKWQGQEEIRRGISLGGAIPSGTIGIRSHFEQREQAIHRAAARERWLRNLRRAA